MIIKIKNLRLRTYIGIYEWEKKKKQDVIINVTIEFDGNKAGWSDDIDDTLNYKNINKGIIKLVEENHFNLIEKIAADVTRFVLENSMVHQVTVEVDKPGALSYTDSVSVSETLTRGD